METSSACPPPPTPQIQEDEISEMEIPSSIQEGEDEITETPRKIQDNEIQEVIEAQILQEDETIEAAIQEDEAPSSTCHPAIEQMIMAPPWKKKRRKNKNKNRNIRNRKRRQEEQQQSGQSNRYYHNGAYSSTTARRNYSSIHTRRRVFSSSSEVSNNNNDIDNATAHHQFHQPIERIMDGKEITEINYATISQEIWAKKRCLKLPTEHLPIPVHFFHWPTWIAADLRDRKHELNKTKSRLDNYPLDKWHEHTNRMNTAGLVMSTVKADIRPEYCSQAWCKLFECLSSFPVIPKRITHSVHAHPRFLSVHLCEAPGAFISATNHYIYTKYPHIHWNWLATTLNPHYEGNDVGNMINEDKLILASLRNWIFLKDSTGNIMNQDNLNSLIDQVQKRSAYFKHPVDLVTADGSIDCQNNPMEQENTVAELQFAEIIAALSILGVGGSFVLKIFTFLECQTINHLYVLCSLFKEVHLYKPATSKEGNSEVYVICLDYMGVNLFRRQLEELKRQVGIQLPLARRFSLVSQKRVFVAPFINRIVQSTKFFTGYQMAIIKRNIETYEKPDDLWLTYFRQDMIRRDVAAAWKIRYGLKIMPREQLLFRLNRFQRSRQIITHVDPRTEIGTHTDKLRLKQSSNLLLKMIEIERQVNFYNALGHELWSISEIAGHCTQITPVMGRPYSNILSSRFCFGKILALRHDLRTAIRPFKGLIRWNNWCEVDIPCSSCDPTSVYFHFSKSLPDVMNSKEQWEFTCLCCKASVNDILNNSDAELMQKILREVLLKTCTLEAGQSLFLCTFPLLSRLQLGFIYALTAVFEMVILGTGGGRDKTSIHPRGILLHRYLGPNTEEDCALVMELGKVVLSMSTLSKETDSANNAILEIVPVKELIELKNFNEILKYNLLNTASELSQLILEAKNAIKGRIQNQTRAAQPTLTTTDNSTKTITTTPRGI